MGRRLAIWDFDGTLARRPGMWTSAALEALQGHASAGRISEEQLRPHLHSGFPWHTPEIVRDPPLSSDAWWSAVEPIFVRAYIAAGVEPEVAGRSASSVRDAYTSAANRIRERFASFSTRIPGATWPS